MVAVRCLSPFFNLCGIVFAVRAVASQLTADCGGTTPHGFCDFPLIGSLMPQLRYAITLFHGKMICHRWCSIPKEKFARLSPIGTSQRCFFLYQFSRLIFRASIAFEIGDRPFSAHTLHCVGVLVKQYHASQGQHQTRSITRQSGIEEL